MPMTKLSTNSGLKDQTFMYISYLYMQIKYKSITVTKIKKDRCLHHNIIRNS